MFVDDNTNSNTGRHSVFCESVVFHIETIIKTKIMTELNKN